MSRHLQKLLESYCCPRFYLSFLAVLTLLLLPRVNCAAPDPSLIVSPPQISAATTPAPAHPISQVVLRLNGSNTIGNDLAPNLCETFLKNEGATLIQRKPGIRDNEIDIEAVLPKENPSAVTIEILTRDSKSAFEDLAARNCDIGMSSRQIETSEAQKCAAAGLGDLSSPKSEKALGKDGIAILVNKSNPVSSLSKQQLADIYSGKITDWSKVGGTPGPIYLYAPNERSGPFESFKAQILGAKTLSQRTSRFENGTMLADAVAADVNGIGFASTAFAAGSKWVGLTTEAGGKPVFPTEFNIATGDYPLFSSLFLYAPADPQNKWTRRFLEFALPKLEIFSWWDSGSEAAALDSLFTQYQKISPGIQMMNAISTGGSRARSVLQTRLTANKPPDTWQSQCGSELLDQYVAPGYCEPVTELYQMNDWDKAFPKALVNMVSQEGKAYGVLTGVHHGNVLWYNKKLLEKNGIKLGDSLSFDEFFAICDKLKASGITALGVGDSGNWTSSQLFENTLLGVLGADGWTDLFNGRMKWDDPKVKKAIQYFAKMQEYVNPDHWTLTWDQVLKELMEGKVAFNSMGDRAEGEFLKARMKENDDFGWVNHPGTEGSFMVVADCFTLAKGAPHKQAAIAWLKSIGSKETQEEFNLLKGSIPARTDVDKSKFDGYHRWSMEEFAKDRLVASCVHGSAAPAEFQQSLDEAVASFVADKDADEFVTALVEAAKDNGSVAPEKIDSPPLSHRPKTLARNEHTFFRPGKRRQVSRPVKRQMSAAQRSAHELEILRRYVASRHRKFGSW